MPPLVCLTFVIQATSFIPCRRALPTASMRARRKRKMRQKADLFPQLNVHGDVALSGPQTMQLCSASMQSRRPQKKSFDPRTARSIPPVFDLSYIQ
jgi:hypothetical protein